MLPCINKVEVDKVKLTSEEDPRAVGGSENVDRVVSFVKLGRLSSAPTISFPKLSETITKPEVPPWEGDLRTVAVAICWGLFLALRKIGIIPPYSVQTKNHEIKGTYQTTGVLFFWEGEYNQLYWQLHHWPDC